MTPDPTPSPLNPDDDALPGDGRDETQTERLDRNWDEILQELRVVQTGTQILTGFLLTIPFQQRFTDLDPVQVDIYLLLVIAASLTTALALAPVSLHRSLFRQRAKGPLVRIGDRILKAVLVGVAVVLTGTVLLVFDVTVGRTAGIVAGGASLIVIASIALSLPALARRLARRSDEA